jgi:hypothetical protein
MLPIELREERQSTYVIAIVFSSLFTFFEFQIFLFFRLM